MATWALTDNQSLPILLSSQKRVLIKRRIGKVSYVQEKSKLLLAMQVKNNSEGVLWTAIDCPFGSFYNPGRQ
jgi:hypothetical protein